MSELKRQNGMLALLLCLGGVLAAVTIVIIGRVFGLNTGMAGFVVFLAFELAAFVLGIQSRQEALGKTAWISALILLMLSIGTLA